MVDAKDDAVTADVPALLVAANRLARSQDPATISVNRITHSFPEVKCFHYT